MRLLTCSRRILILLGVLLSIPVSAKDYPSTFEKAFRALQKGDTKEILKVYRKDAEKDRDKDKLLYQYELASMYQMLGDPKESVQWFAQADDLAHIYEGRAVVSGNAVARTAGSMLTSDKILMYQGAGYEKVMSRTLDALNYLLLSDLEGARVEIRKAEEYQELERTKHQKAIAAAEEKQANDATERQAAQQANSNPMLRQRLAPMANYASKVRNSFENAYTYYLSGLVYEAAGGADAINDAHIDFKRAYDLAPDSPAVRQAYLDSARRFDRKEYQELSQQFSLAVKEPPPDSAVVTVLFEQGLIPEKHELRLDLPVPVANRVQIVPLAFPVYNPAEQTPMAPLRIRSGDREYTTSPLLDVRPIAVKALMEKLPGIMTRAIARGIAKTAVESNVEQRAGGIAGLAAKLWAVLSTRADLRGWYSLPAEVQAARFYVPPGSHQLEFSQQGFSDEVSLDAAPGGSYLFVVRAAPGFHKTLQAMLSHPPGAPSAVAGEAVQATQSPATNQTAVAPPAAHQPAQVPSADPNPAPQSMPPSGQTGAGAESPSQGQPSVEGYHDIAH